MFPRRFDRLGCRLAMILPLLTICPRVSSAEPRTIRLQDLMPDLTKVRQESDSVTFVVWFPREFFQASMSSNTRASGEGAGETLKLFSPYTIFKVADGSVGGLGGTSFRSEAELRKEIKVTDAKGTAYEPLAEDDIPPKLKPVLAFFKSAKVGGGGPFGDNVHVFVFRDTGPDGACLFDPTKKGSLVVKLGEKEFKWRLPLGSVVPPKWCPKCKEERSGAWDYCPWCGTELRPKESN